jgi:hypothetical protein
MNYKVIKLGCQDCGLEGTGQVSSQSSNGVKMRGGNATPVREFVIDSWARGSRQAILLSGDKGAQQAHSSLGMDHKDASPSFEFLVLTSELDNFKRQNSQLISYRKFLFPISSFSSLVSLASWWFLQEPQPKRQIMSWWLIVIRMELSSQMTA